MAEVTAANADEWLSPADIRRIVTEQVAPLKSQIADLTGHVHKLEATIKDLTFTNEKNQARMKELESQDQQNQARIKQLEADNLKYKQRFIKAKSLLKIDTKGEEDDDQALESCATGLLKDVGDVARSALKTVSDAITPSASTKPAFNCPRGLRRHNWFSCCACVRASCRKDCYGSLTSSSSSPSETRPLQVSTS